MKKINVFDIQGELLFYHLSDNIGDANIWVLNRQKTGSILPEYTIEIVDYVIQELTVIEKRIKAYNSRGCTREDILDAIIQKYFDNDNTKWNVIDTERKKIKLEFPKD